MKKKDSLNNNLSPNRPPVVTLMGHVDHGKTSLLDYIRKTRTQAREAGGITQQTSAYQVAVNDKLITFVDTPGHQAFTAMRMRGGQIADLVVLVIASNDGVKPQTKECLSHLKLAKTPFLIAFNKSDLPEADVGLCRKQLAEEGILTEKYGGDVVEVEVSAKTGKGIDNLLEMILLMAEMQELKDDRQADLEAVILEGRMDSKRGASATAIVKQGVLRVGQEVATPTARGKIKALFDFNNRPLKIAYPSMPAEIMGLDKTPLAGEWLVLASKASDKTTPTEEGGKPLLAKADNKNVRLLNIVLKANTRGALEALRSALVKLENDQQQINFIHSGVGEISESDILLAVAGGASIFGFETRLSNKVRLLAQDNRVFVKTYKIIYRLLEDVEKSFAGVLSDEEKQIKGRAEVKKIFKLPESGDLVLGCLVLLGNLVAGARVKVLRGDNKEVVFEGRIKKIQRLKEQVKNAPRGTECGILLRPAFTSPEKGDIIEIV